MGDSVFSFAFGFVGIIVGLLTLRAKSLILPGYQSFGLSEDASWLLQKLSGWLALALGAFALASGSIGLAQVLFGLGAA